MTLKCKVATGNENVKIVIRAYLRHKRIDLGCVKPKPKLSAVHGHSIVEHISSAEMLGFSGNALAACRSRPMTVHVHLLATDYILVLLK